MPTALPQKPFTAGMIIPTGIGARVGGFGGDATPAMNLLASVCDLLITHPNVANAAMFQRLPQNAWYVEGYALDQFFRGHWQLSPVRQNRVGLLLDAGISADMRTLHLNTTNAVQSVYGVEVMGYVQTEEPVQVTYSLSPSGSSQGSVENPHVLVQAAQQLLDQGATALAVCVQLPDPPEADPYREGNGVDPIGGIEAIVSHLLVSTFHVPVAHAPVFSKESAMPEWEQVVDPRAASEYITPTFLPCILTGLARAPQIETDPSSARAHSVGVRDVDALVTPADALGGIPAMACLSRGIPIIAVSENTTVMEMPPAVWQPHWPQARILQAHSYAEAAGLLQAMRLGLRLPLTDCLPTPRLITADST
jgi:hypothetical protein